MGLFFFYFVFWLFLTYGIYQFAILLHPDVGFMMWVPFIPAGIVAGIITMILAVGTKELSNSKKKWKTEEKSSKASQDDNDPSSNNE